MDGGFREWLDGLSGRELVVYGLLAVLVAGGVGLWLLRQGAAPGPVPEESPAAVTGPRAEPSPAPILVHVAGLVRRPGVYELPEGARVIDAIELAGGALGRAALDVLNLAALLTDGQQVVVPRKGTGGEAASGPGGPAATPKVNVNTAGATELETLPGIGEVLAQRIIDHREEHGPFASVDELIEVSGIGEVTLEELRDLVTV